MACRSVNNLRLSRDDLRRAYRDEALNCGGPIKIKHIIKIIEILGPIIPHFFRGSNVDANSNCNSGRYGMSRPHNDMGYSGEEDMSFHSSGRYGMGRSHNDMSFRSDYNDFGGMSSYGHGGMHHHHKMSHADDFGERSISEEEFERLLDFAEQQNVKMY